MGSQGSVFSSFYPEALSVLFKALTYASGPFPLNPSGVKYFSFTGITPHHALFVRIRSNHTSFGDIFDFH